MPHWPEPNISNAALNWAIKRRETEAAEVLVQRCSENAIDCALTSAINNQGESKIPELLASHCSGGAAEATIQYAAHQEKWQVVRILFLKCAPGCAALGGALNNGALAGKRDVVEIIWGKCNAKDVARPLENAAREGKWDVVEFLHPQCESESKELGITLLCAIEKTKWGIAEQVYPKCRERDLVEALKMVVIQRHWDVAKLLCEELQKKEYEGALQLKDKDDGRRLLDLLYQRCRCYDAEKAIVEATKQLNWAAIKLLAHACYSKSANVDKAFKLAVEMDRWDVVKRLYLECSDDTVSEAMKNADARGKPEIVRIMQNNSSTLDAAETLSRLSLGEEDVPIRVTPELNVELETIRCLHPGFDPFDIDVSSADAVGNLKKLLHAERLDLFGDVSADSIWLYLAQRGDEWLSEDSEDIRLLAIGDSSRVRNLLVW